jgi:hypothetical protein
VFENRVLRRIFGPKRDAVTGEWRKVHNEELRDLYSSPSIIKARRMRWAEHVARMREYECILVINSKARRKETTSKPTIRISNSLIAHFLDSDSPSPLLFLCFACDLTLHLCWKTVGTESNYSLTKPLIGISFIDHTNLIYRATVSI